MRAVVGVDAGASHTEAVADVDGARAGSRWRGGPGAIQPGREAAAVTRWVEAVTGILPDGVGPTAVAVGAAGAGPDEVRRTAERLLAQAFGEATLVRVTTDGEIALEAAFPEGRPGIVVTAGSGSNAFARDAHGAVRRVGGLGRQFGDEGSGYALGRDAIAAVGRALDGRGPRTELTTRLTEAAAIGRPEELVPWARGTTPRAIAALARVVAETAETGDAIAAGLVADAAADLAAHVGALLPQLRAVSPVPVALNGGLLQPGSAVRTALLGLLRQRHAPVEVVEALVDPPLGALRLALALP
jgi:N-acetylglucosamine kinase-like BadF-type ATPase